MLKFRSKYGHMDVSGSASPELSDFLTHFMNRLRKVSVVKLTKSERLDLQMKGLGDLTKMPRKGRPTNGGKTPLKLVPLERVKEVNYWVGMLEQLKAYQAKHNTLEFPRAKFS